ncbi:MAG: hypothetical protein K1X78_06030 [Verrucomicrobiaceae bacterium]|nr:hypothetical protein [Verrucomicrobiaceae bacterium]
MKIRALVYWVLSVLVATFAAQRALGASSEVEAVVASPAASLVSLGAVPDAARSVLLFVGIMAVAYTYQRAWINFRGDSSS